MLSENERNMNDKKKEKLLLTVPQILEKLNRDLKHWTPEEKESVANQLREQLKNPPTRR